MAAFSSFVSLLVFVVCFPLLLCDLALLPAAYQLTVPNPDSTLTNLSARAKHERPPEGGMHWWHDSCIVVANSKVNCMYTYYTARDSDPKHTYGPQIVRFKLAVREPTLRQVLLTSCTACCPLNSEAAKLV